MRLIKNLLLGVLVVLWVYGCGGGSEISIEGQFHGVADKNVLLERLSPTGSMVVDSARTSPDGEFRFEIKPQDANPTFYNVRYQDSYIPLLLETGQRVKLDALGNIYYNYQVEGSEGSARLRELTQLTTRQARSLDSISRLYESALDADHALSLGRAYGAKYIQLKRSVITFVIQNCSSLVSIVPLYQPLFGQKFIFDEPTDIVYFKAVADSLQVHYPSSPYVQSLRADMERLDQAAIFDSLLVAGASSQLDLPKIEAKDPSGKVRRLSDLKGKVVLLEFTSYGPKSFKADNQELIPLYNKHKAAGFEVFQVCVDMDKAAWIRAVLDARLPWTTVNDLQGNRSPLLAAYNIKQIPTRILIDRTGTIIGRDQYESALELAVASAL